jgi:sulfite reductase (ferredoxin)
MTLKAKKYFYEFLKPLADLTNLTEADFVDWGNADNYVKAVGVVNALESCD